MDGRLEEGSWRTRCRMAQRVDCDRLLEALVLPVCPSEVCFCPIRGCHVPYVARETSPPRRCHKLQQSSKGRDGDGWVRS